MGSRLNQLWPISYNGTLATTEGDNAEALHVLQCTGMPQRGQYATLGKKKKARRGKNTRCLLEERNPAEE